MEIPTIECKNVDEAVNTSLNSFTPVMCTLNSLSFPTEFDAVCDVVVKYNDPPPDHPTFQVIGKKGEIVLSVPLQSSGLFQVPLFTKEYPFLACVVPQYSFKFHPPPSSISGLGIFYPPLTRYRLLSAKHSWKVHKEIWTYNPFTNDIEKQQKE
jgi:hypothetical protein